jgi:hypothetical protein
MNKICIEAIVFYFRHLKQNMIEYKMDNIKVLNKCTVR